MAPAGHDGIDLDRAALTGNGIDTAANTVQRPPQGIAHLVQCNKTDCLLVTDPLQWHAGYVGSQYLLLKVHHLRILQPCSWLYIWFSSKWQVNEQVATGRLEKTLILCEWTG